jgi:hypothetical protein
MDHRRGGRHGRDISPSAPKVVASAHSSVPDSPTVSPDRRAVRARATFECRHCSGSPTNSSSPPQPNAMALRYSPQPLRAAAATPVDEAGYDGGSSRSCSVSISSMRSSLAVHATSTPLWQSPAASHAASVAELPSTPELLRAHSPARLRSPVRGPSPLVRPGPSPQEPMRLSPARMAKLNANRPPAGDRALAAASSGDHSPGSLGCFEGHRLPMPGSLSPPSGATTTRTHVSTPRGGVFSSAELGVSELVAAAMASGLARAQREELGHPRTWDARQVAAFVAALDAPALARHAPSFLANGVDGARLATLGAHMLPQLGVCRFDEISALLAHIRAALEIAPPPPAPPRAAAVHAPPPPPPKPRPRFDEQRYRRLHETLAREAAEAKAMAPGKGASLHHLSLIQQLLFERGGGGAIGSQAVASMLRQLSA